MGVAVDSPAHRALAGGGDLGQRIRAHDWAATPLGPIAGWPQSLITSLSVILNAQMPMWLGWGPEIVFFYNDAYIDVLSQAKHPWALGRPAAEVWREIWDVCGPLAARVFRDGAAPYVEDVRLFMDRGDFLEEVYYSFSYSPIRDDSGAIAGLFCPNSEVTAKLLGARRLRTLSELAASALVEKTVAATTASVAATLARNPDDVPFAALYLTDADDQPALVEAVGLARAQAAPDRWPVAEVLATGVPTLVELRADHGLPRGLAGQPVRQALALPIASSTELRPWGVLVAGVNPTRRLDTEYRAFLELIAAQTAAALQNASSAEYERRRADTLAELDRAKTTFFSNISHEFRTPLTLMIGPLEDALGHGRSLSGDALHRVYRNALRQLKLVNALLDFSRLEAGRMTALREPVDLAQLTRDLASGFRAAIERAGLTFEVDVAPLPGPVAVDRDMWEKIVLNLLSNALKFTLTGAIRVQLRADGGTAVLTVADTGTGIPSAEMPRLFERFQRIDNPHARTQEGSGIGLALVDELTRLHGGQVTVDSLLGRGTTFSVAIPLASRADASDGAIVVPVDAAGKGDATARSTTTTAAHLLEAQRWSRDAGAAPSAGPADAETILLADDNADMRDYLGRLLAEHWQVVVAADGNEAVALARTRAPDLVVSDVMMPGLDGFGVLQALRADPATAAVPVILLSARAGDEARVEGLAAGADDYVVKPFSARELVARVRTHLTLAGLRRQAERDRAAAREQAERALQAGRAKDEFLAMLGHELRNPLAPITTALELLKLKGAADSREYATIARQVAHLSRLVDDLLDISRLTRGLIELTRERIKLRDVITKAIEIARPLMARKAHALTVDLADDVQLDGDPVRLAQVFSNILNNAARYTPDGGHIAVRARRRGDRVEVRIQDDGIGIDADMLGKIFDLFVQGAGDVARSAGGLGIGLALVQSFVRLHGGEVAAYSEGRGRGSELVVELPVLEDGPARRPSSQATAVAPIAARRILLVDDNVDAVEILAEVLQGLGHEVAVAHDGPSALAQLGRFQPEVAVLDVGLPVMDGYELARRVRAVVADCRLIALTGYGQESDREHSAAAGFAVHLVKPVKLDLLLRAVDGDRQT